MDNTAFEGGEAVLLAARGIPVESSNGRAAGGDEERGGQDWVVSMEMGASRGQSASPPVIHTNGGPNCHCPSEKSPDRDSKSPSPPPPVVSQQSPWHRHKSVYLTIIVVSLVLWVVLYTIFSQLNLA